VLGAIRADWTKVGSLSVEVRLKEHRRCLEAPDPAVAQHLSEPQVVVLAFGRQLLNVAGWNRIELVPHQDNRGV
jgi:hypothetical protein